MIRVKKGTSKILVYIVIFLTVLNLATLITIGVHIAGSKTGEVNTPETTESSAEGFSGRYFQDRLKLDNGQMATFRNVNSGFRLHAREIKRSLIDQKQQMLKEMQKTNPDTVALNAFSDSIGQLHNLLKRYTYEYYLGIKGICNEQQQVELKGIFEEFFINDLHPGRHRKRGNGGPKRYGWNRNNN